MAGVIGAVAALLAIPTTLVTLRQQIFGGSDSDVVVQPAENREIATFRESAGHFEESRRF